MMPKPSLKQSANGRAPIYLLAAGAALGMLSGRQHWLFQGSSNRTTPAAAFWSMSLARLR
jgi:hypothetical protein